ncbi:hypothetical protein [Salibaculum sp.]|uniref:hypothetical protein n=1 Tax=Salibaculum sp. TaxID=2855480 RepID=UPI002B49207D|nr:hypothetical protein [Salibaculum sp.]HKL69573.1 hypothetical protein [Salibaculum sp.]
MIVSHDHKLIFLKPQKVAGTSFEIALSRYLGRRDIITPVAPEDEAVRRKAGFRGAQHHEFTPRDLLHQRKYKEVGKALLRRRMPRKYFHHIPASAVKRRVGDQIWHDYLKVSIVRNPWDIVVSKFYWDQGRDADIADLTRWSIANPEFFAFNRRMYLIDEAPVIDHFLRYEHFRDDILALEDRRPALAGLADTLAGIKAKGASRKAGSRDLPAIYADHPKVAALVDVFFEYEINRFGYTLDPG